MYIWTSENEKLVASQTFRADISLIWFCILRSWYGVSEFLVCHHSSVGITVNSSTSFMSRRVTILVQVIHSWIKIINICSKLPAFPNLQSYILFSSPSKGLWVRWSEFQRSLKSGKCSQPLWRTEVTNRSLLKDPRREYSTKNSRNKAYRRQVHDPQTQEAGNEDRCIRWWNCASCIQPVNVNLFSEDQCICCLSKELLWKLW